MPPKSKKSSSANAVSVLGDAALPHSSGEPPSTSLVQPDHSVNALHALPDRSLRPEISKFLGFNEVNVRDWCDNYELITTACRVDPAFAFPNHCVYKVLSRLRQRGARFVCDGWPTLRALLESTYGRPVNKVQLQSQLQQRRQLMEESVSQYADQLDTIATQLGTRLDDIIGIFVNGLAQPIADSLVDYTFTSFDEALRVARTIEENMLSRQPRAAVALPAGGAVNATIAATAPSLGQEERIPAGWLQSIAAAQLNGKRSFGKFKREFRRQSREPVAGRSSLTFSGSSAAVGAVVLKCEVCGMPGHKKSDCRLLVAINKRREQFGLSALLLTLETSEVDLDIQLGPRALALLSIGSSRLQCLVDTGATASFVHSAVLPRLSNCITQAPTSHSFTAGNGLQVEHDRTIVTTVTIHENLPALQHRFVVSNALPFDVVIGTDLLVKFGATVDVCQGRLLLPFGNSVQMMCRESQILQVMTDGQDADFDSDVLLNSTENGEVVGFAVNSLLPLSDAESLNSLLAQHEQVFQQPTGDAPCMFSPFDVEVTDGTPIYTRPFRIPYVEREAISQHIQKYLQRGWIVPSTSPWSSPTVIVWHNGKERFVVDYRRLNARTVPDSFPAPNVQDMLDRMQGCRYFTLCDAEAAYHQCALTPGAQTKLAFSTHDGHFQPTVLLFGPRNAPSYFQRNINQALAGLQHTWAYLDDIVIATASFEEHLEALTKLLQRLSLTVCGLRLKRSKCSFAQYSIKYLGFKVSAEGIAVDDEKTSAISHLAVPSNVQQLRRFLGMCAYYGQFVQNFALVASPLYYLTRKDVTWCWGQAQQGAFVQLKQLLCAAPVLAVVDFSRGLEVLTDASAQALGAVLQQRDDDGMPHPIAFASRVLSSAESRYHTQELECLAVIFALRKFRTYLLGHSFVLYTDHRALLSVLTKTSPSPRITRWSLLMQEFDFEIVHLPGISHVVPDALSRAESLLCTLIDDPMNVELWRAHQTNDVFCQSVVAQISMLGAGVKDFALDANGLLFLHQSENLIRVVVPLTLRETVFVLIHSSPTAGHPGINRSIARCHASFFWPGWRRDIAVMVRACMSCQQRKDPARPDREQRPRGQVTSRGPGDLVAMDLQGPLIQSQHGNRYILVIQDVFTKFVVITAVPDVTSVSIVDTFLAHWVAHYNIPFRLLTDNASYFTSDMMTEVFIMLKIQKIWTSPYNPQADPVERMNRTLNAMLSHYIGVAQDNWDTFLPLLAMAYNSTFHYSVQSTPYFLMFGRHPPSFSEALVHAPREDSTAFGGEMRAALRNVVAAVYQDILLQQSHREDEVQRHNASVPASSSYKIGEEVLILDLVTPVGISSKHRRKWTGPYSVSEIHGPLSYVVESLSGHQRYRVHADHMKRVYKLFPEDSSTQLQARVWPSQYAAGTSRDERTPSSLSSSNMAVESLPPTVPASSLSSVPALESTNVQSASGVSSKTSSPEYDAAKSTPGATGVPNRPQRSMQARRRPARTASD